MRAVVAKRIRRQVYGCGHHIGPVIRYWGTPHQARHSQKKSVLARLEAGLGICLITDDSRRAYKAAKKAYRRPT